MEPGKVINVTAKRVVSVDLQARLDMLNLELVASIQADIKQLTFRPDRTSLFGDSDHVPDYDADDALTSLKQRVHAPITEG